MGSFGQKPALDPRQQPTPDYGALGPGSDINPAAAVNPAADPSLRVSESGSLKPVFAGGSKRAVSTGKPTPAVQAVVIGVGCALVLLGMRGTFQEAARRLESFFDVRGNGNTAPRGVSVSRRDLERQTAQQQTELLLERAVNDYEGTNDQIAARVNHWRGQLKMTPNLRALTTAALNSNDMRVRAAGIEVDLAAYDIPKTPAEARAMERRADSSDHTTKIWALWTLGALANRGVEPEEITQTLISHLKEEQDPSARQWAVEGVALVGSDATIAPLLAALHDDPSAIVRERAACSLAQSGMLKPEQRMAAVPQLLIFSDDPALDAQTRTWVFQALRDITAQNLPNDPAAWRQWWQERGK